MKEGNIINIVPVEMRGMTFQGNIVDGDRVIAKGKMKDGTIMTKEVLNTSTNSKIKVK